MRPFNKPPSQVVSGNKEIHVFETEKDNNTDLPTVESFGAEWNKFYQFNDDDINKTAREYFDILDESLLTKSSYVLDLGCGTGRWTKFLSSRVQFIEAIDPSSAIYAADKLLTGVANVRLIKTSVENIPFDDGTFDFVMSIGVLHHIPDTQKAMKRCVEKLKPGGSFYVYLYYNLDNRGILFKTVFRISNLVRLAVSSMPEKPKLIACDVLAFTLYLPFIYLSRLLRKGGMTNLANRIPLNAYHNKSWFVIRANALDRFGTPLEQRFSKAQVAAMMKAAGLDNIIISPNMPYYHAIGRKAL